MQGSTPEREIKRQRRSTNNNHSQHDSRKSSIRFSENNEDRISSNESRFVRREANTTNKKTRKETTTRKKTPEEEIDDTTFPYLLSLPALREPTRNDETFVVVNRMIREDFNFYRRTPASFYEGTPIHPPANIVVPLITTLIYRRPDIVRIIMGRSSFRFKIANVEVGAVKFPTHLLYFLLKKSFDSTNIIVYKNSYIPEIEKACKNILEEGGLKTGVTYLFEDITSKDRKTTVVDFTNFMVKFAPHPRILAALGTLYPTEAKNFYNDLKNNTTAYAKQIKVEFEKNNLHK